MILQHVLRITSPRSCAVEIAHNSLRSSSQHQWLRWGETSKFKLITFDFWANHKRKVFAGGSKSAPRCTCKNHSKYLSTQVIIILRKAHNGCTFARRIKMLVLMIGTYSQERLSIASNPNQENVVWSLSATWISSHTSAYLLLLQTPERFDRQNTPPPCSRDCGLLADTSIRASDARDKVMQ